MTCEFAERELWDLAIAFTITERLRLADGSSPRMFPRNKSGDPDYDAYEALRSPDFRFLITGSFPQFAGDGDSLGYYRVRAVRPDWLGVGVGYGRAGPDRAECAAGIAGGADRRSLEPEANRGRGDVSECDRRDGLAVLTHYVGPLFLIYLCLFFIGMGRAFLAPTRGTLLAAVAPEDQVHQCGGVVVLGQSDRDDHGSGVGGSGGRTAGNSAPVFAVASVLLFCGAIAYTQIHPRPMARSKEPISKESLMAGIRFIYNRKVLLAAITLDMVAVLLGGATALLPISPRMCCTLGRSGSESCGRRRRSGRW